MRIRADEHIAEQIVRAVRDIALRPDWELTHVVEVGDRGLADEHWITRFAKEGGHAILTADTDFLRRAHQVLAVHQTGLRIIHLPNKWANARGDLQAAHVLLWWRRIETTIAEMKSRECYRPVWNIREDGKLLKIKIDYESARKRSRKAARRNN